MDMKKGTPNTLNQAIANGLDDAGESIPDKNQEIIKTHIRDFLSQKFSWAMMNCYEDPEKEEMIAQLWEKITGEKIK